MPVTISNNRLGLLAILLLLAGACQRRADFFFVAHQGAVMPVQVAGDAGASTYLVLLPGGPAGDGLVYRRLFPMFTDHLEPYCQVVYYDARGGGNCQGTYATASLQLAQLAEDLDQLISVLQERQPGARIFLLGYSYGGALGLTYLLEPAYRAKIAGFISLAGAFDRRYQARYQAALLESYLDQWVAEEYITSYAALQTGFTCATQPDPAQCRRDSVLLQQKVAEKLTEMEGYSQFPVNGASLSRLLGVVFFSPTNPLTSGQHEGQNGPYFQPEFDQLLFTGQAALDQVDTPMLFLAGRWDTNVPFFDARQIMQSIGTSDADKSLHILEASGHLPMLTEPLLVAGQIREFMATH
jgi:pimeloyl-ACP methyl ester carboxylesterase